jgi:MFS family permease
VLGSFRSIFHPAMMSSVPTIVTGEELAVANGVLSATFHLAIMIGPAIGGILVASIGADGAFVFNAASFAVSALLLIGLRLSGPAREHPRVGRFTPLEDLVEGARFLWRSRVARGVTVLMGLSLFLLAMQAAFQPAFVGEVLVPSDDLPRRAAVIAAMVAMFGAGMVLGSVVGPALAHRMRSRWLFASATAVVGLAFAAASRQHDIPVVVAAWGVAGLCGGIVNVLYETLLQVHTPDRFRGRVFAAVESVQDGAYVLGAAIVALFWTVTSPSTALLRVGLGFGVVSILTLWLLPNQASVRGAPGDEP